MKLVESNIIFKNLTENMYDDLYNKLSNCNYQITEYSVGTQIMWKNILNPSYYITDDFVIIKFITDNETLFLYPHIYNENCLDKKTTIDEALNTIEKYCCENNIPLKIVNVPEREIDVLVKRYPYFESSCLRYNKDYVYEAESLITLKGRALSKRKNKLNQFNKQYENVTFRRLTFEDKNIIDDFFVEFESKISKEKTNDVLTELSNAKYLFSLLKYDFLLAGGLFYNNKLIGIKLGEKYGNTLITHIEKALYEYDGVYVKLMNEYYKYFSDGIQYLNREDDANDKGLRQAKLAYNPTILLNKYWVKSPNKYFEKIKDFPVIQTERLTINQFHDNDKEKYIELSSNLEINKLYGEDVLNTTKELFDKQIINEDNPIKVCEYYFNNKIALDFAIRYNNNLAGEVILYDYDFKGNIEIGIRLFTEYTNKGIAYETVEAVCKYAIYNLGFNTIKAKVFKENIKSKKLFDKIMNIIKEDKDFFYYVKKL